MTARLMLAHTHIFVIGVLLEVVNADEFFCNHRTTLTTAPRTRTPCTRTTLRHAEEARGEDEDEADMEEDAGGAEAPGAAGAEGAGLSAHERRLARMAARIARMEEANMGEREWFLRGEASAGARSGAQGHLP